MVVARKTWVLGSLIAIAMTVPPAMAHDDTHGSPPSTIATKAVQKPFGIAGDPKRVSRTITISMSDDMRFSPSTLDIKRGATIRFVLTNTGKVLHEMVIGTLPDLQAHAAMMKRMPGMQHDEPYMTHVPPGATGSVVWNFNRAGEFRFACLVAGHLEAGMIGKVIVK